MHVIGDAERPLEPAFIHTAAVDIDALDEIPGIVQLFFQFLVGRQLSGKKVHRQGPDRFVGMRASKDQCVFAAVPNLDQLNRMSCPRVSHTANLHTVRILARQLLCALVQLVHRYKAGVIRHPCDDFFHIHAHFPPFRLIFFWKTRAKSHAPR